MWFRREFRISRSVATMLRGTRYLWTEEAVAQKVRYVLDEQGEPLERYPSRACSAAE